MNLLSKSRKIKRSFSLSKRLISIFFLTNACTLTLVFLVFTAIQVSFSLKSFYEDLYSLSAVIASNSRAALAFGDTSAAQRILSTLTEKDDIVYAELTHHSAGMVATFGKLPAGVNLDEHRGNSTAWSLNHFQFSTPVILDGERLGTITIVAGLSSLYKQVGLLFLSGILVTAAAGWATYFFAKRLTLWVLKPVEKLKNLAQEVSLTKDFSHRLAPMREEEINELRKALNFMLEQIELRDRSLLNAKQVAEDANQAKSRFVANVSHELRTPLHAILGLTDELLGTALTEEQTDLLSTLKNSGDSLLSIINDILDFSKIDAGKLTLAPSHFELRDFMVKTMKMFEHPFHIKGVSLHSKVEDDVPNVMIGDKGRLSQMLVNILGNALKFTPAGGQVFTRVSMHHYAEGAPRKHLVSFAVSDTGIGIPPDRIDTIFDSFVQVTNESDSRCGTGLGLAIVNRLTKLMNGRIDVESRPGVGSTFTFIVELEESLEPGSIESPEEVLDENLDAKNYPRTLNLSRHFIASQATGNTTVLVVEDHPVNQKLMERILQKSGFNVLIAGDGRECLSLLKANRIDLIIMDLNMPVMDGLTATRLIRSRERDAGEDRMPILALTAQAGADCVAECEAAGMDAVLTKPVSKVVLLEEIARRLKFRSAHHVHRSQSSQS